MHVWIVEMWFSGSGWKATVEMALTREQGRIILQREWQRKMPDEHFRLRRYERSEDK